MRTGVGVLGAGGRDRASSRRLLLLWSALAPPHPYVDLPLPPSSLAVQRSCRCQRSRDAQTPDKSASLPSSFTIAEAAAASALPSGLVPPMMAPFALRPAPPSLDEILQELDLDGLPTKQQTADRIRRDFLTPPRHLSDPSWLDSFALCVQLVCELERRRPISKTRRDARRLSYSWPALDGNVLTELLILV